MEIKISIEKKYIWLLILAIAATGLTVAYNYPGPPSAMGHSIGEVDGVDQKVIDVMNAQNATYLSGKNIIEGRLVALGSQTTFQWNGQDTSLAQYTTVYGRGTPMLEYKGCLSAMYAYCTTQSYSAAVPVITSCGWAIEQDRPCPTNPCSLHFYCLKEK